MSFVTNTAYNAEKCIDFIKCKLYAAESGEGAIPAESWVNSIIKVAVIFIIGIVILQGVTDNTGLNNTSAPFYSLAISVKSSITSGYTLASLMIMVLGAAAITHYLGFI
jgi:hypothetical protein